MATDPPSSQHHLMLPAAPASGQLQLRLGLVFALAISVGNIIGSGIMRTPGLVADEVPVGAAAIQAAER
jgi:hypothetical protein